MPGPYPSDQGQPAGAIPVYITSGAAGTTGPKNIQLGSSSNGVVGTTSTPIVAANTYKGWVTVQNTSATNILYVSFNAASTADFAIAPGGALTLPFGPTNILYGLGSAAGTGYAVIGY